MKITKINSKQCFKLYHPNRLGFTTTRPLLVTYGLVDLAGDSEDGDLPAGEGKGSGFAVDEAVNWSEPTGGGTTFSGNDTSLSTAGSKGWLSLSDPRAGQTRKCCRLRRYLLPSSVCTTYDLGVW